MEWWDNLTGWYDSVVLEHGITPVAGVVVFSAGILVLAALSVRAYLKQAKIARETEEETWAPVRGSRKDRHRTKF